MHRLSGADITGSDFFRESGTTSACASISEQAKPISRPPAQASRMASTWLVQNCHHPELDTLAPP